MILPDCVNFGLRLCCFFDFVLEDEGLYSNEDCIEKMQDVEVRNATLKVSHLPALSNQP